MTANDRSYVAPPRFETFTISDGLVSNEANVFLQDRQGFLWIGTFGGLSRFDGASFTNFLHRPSDTTSLAQNKVNSLAEDRAGFIWVGTNGGLDRFDPKTKTFTHYHHEPTDTASLSHEVVRAIVEGADGDIWAGTRGGGLNRIDSSTGVLTRVHRSLSDSSAVEDEVHALLSNPDGTLWIGGSDGLTLFDPVAQTFSLVHRNPEDPNAPLPIVYSLCRDPDGSIWAGTREEGLFRYDPETNTVAHYPSNPTERRAIGNPWILSMTVDDTGTLWIGTNGAGLHRYDRAEDAFTRFEYSASDPESLRDNNVLAVFESRDGVLWVGTYGGLARRYPLSRFVVREGVRPIDDRGLRSNAVTAFAEDSSGTLWVGTDGGGLNRQGPSADSGFEQVTYDTLSPASRAAIDVLSLTIDHTGALWVGAIGALYRQNPASGRFDRLDDSDVDGKTRMMFIYDLEAERERVIAGAGLGGVMDIDINEDHTVRTVFADSNEAVTTVLLDASGQIWAGTYNVGLWRVVEVSDTARHLEHVPLNLTSEQVNTLYEDRAGAIWIGTGDGLSRLTVNGADTSLTRFHRADRLPDTVIRGIAEDRRGRLWIATSTGLSRYDAENSTFVSYDTRDGMVPGGPLFRSPHSGRLYVGGNFGYAVFDADALTIEPPPPAPVLTALHLRNEPVRIGAEGSPLDGSLSTTDELQLRHADRVVTIAFASLDFRAPSKHRYAVRLDGFDEDWRHIGQQRQATFTGLSPGSYTFRVRAAGRAGIWGPESVLDVTILPPWWRTGWAYLTYALLAGGLLVAAYRERQNRLQLRHRLEMERMEAEKLRELDHARSRFFADVSHEFRTPLTLTIGPLNDILTGRYGPVDDSIAEHMDLARRNANRVLELINQILDVARLEAGRLPLHVRPLDFVSFVENAVEPFKTLAEQNAIALEVSSPECPVRVVADPAHLEKVVRNLLSNAIKFVPRGGTIRVTITANDEAAQVTVRDSGPGIPATDMPHVFERYYQADEVAKGKLGTGIGLALAKEITELHGGTLSVDSQEGFGSTFVVTLPLGRTHLAQEHLDGDVTPWTTNTPFSVPEPLDVAEKSVDVDPTLDITTVLVVEDHPEVRTYIRKHLESGPEGHPSYRVLEAADGEAALALARERLPDLILSDVMMPKLDGLELCRALKEDPNTDFIPIILLSAKAAPEDKLEGLREHADDYMTKPFDIAELRMRIANLIDSRARLRERYRQEGIALLVGEAPLPSIRLSPQSPIPSDAERFLEAVSETIEAHLADETFSVQKLADGVGVSRGHLHRQLKSLVGQTPTSVIRKLRLERATHLLAAESGTVSEIAYAVGFKSLGHFSDSFKQEYGCRPSAYNRERAAVDKHL